MSDKLRELSALTALNAMMEGTYFSICVIDSVAEMLKRSPRGEAYSILKPLHCVRFDKMPKELRDLLPSLIGECLGTPMIYQFTTLTQSADVIDITTQKEQAETEGSFWKRRALKWKL